MTFTMDKQIKIKKMNELLTEVKKLEKRWYQERSKNPKSELSKKLLQKIVRCRIDYDDLYEGRVKTEQ